MTPKQVLQLCATKKVENVDLCFMDFPGTWQHTSHPVDELTEQSFSSGFGFDGSTLRGWQAINESDMLILPDPHSAFLDPFAQHQTLELICDIKDPLTRATYSRDPRSVAKKCEAFLAQSGIADSARFGPEIEFFIFDHARFDQSINAAHYTVESHEGVWRRGNPDPANKGLQIRPREGYYPTSPFDSFYDLRCEMVSLLNDCGIAVKQHHHEVATGGQCEIVLKHDDLVRISDRVARFKYVLRNAAARAGKVVTFMPKPLFGDNGSGMHTHFSLWKDAKPLFGGEQYARLSQHGLWAIGGLIKHARALCAFTNPITNSYKRLVPGYEAPVNVIYSSRNRAAAIRVPVYQENPNTKRLEIRFPDPACLPYLAFSAITMAAIDGIINKIDPGDPVDTDFYEMDPSTVARFPVLPATLEEALESLDRDNDFLLRGDVFTPDLIHHWIRYKTENEVNALRRRPHPWEFCINFDC